MINEVPKIHDSTLRDIPGRRVPTYSCKREDHKAHVPNFMRCVQCAYAWMDCPGETGVNYKNGCPACASIYWTSEAPRALGKLRYLIERGRVQ